MRKKSKMSRTKGRRGEQELVLYLKNQGFKAERILKQYQEAGQPDVLATKNDVKLTFENKLRRDSFKSIYDLYYSERGSDKSFRFVLDKAVEISIELSTLLHSDKHFRNLRLFPPTPKQLKVYERIIRLAKLKQDADVLVLKDNGKPRLFLRYW